MLKPFNYSEFLEAVEKVQKIRISPIAENQQQINYMFIKSDYKQFKINYDDIIYIEGLKDYVKIYLTSQATPILTLLSLKKLTEQLPSDKFMRVHRSFIVALNKVQEIERNQIILGK